MHPAHGTIKMVGRPPKPPFRPEPSPTPTPSPQKEPAYPPSGTRQGNLLLVFAPSCCNRSPSKALPKFVSPLTNFYSLRSPGTFISNILCKGMLSPSQERIWAPPGPPNAASFVCRSPLNLPLQHHHPR